MTRRWLWLVIGLFISLQVRAEQTTSEAFEVGKNLGNGKSQASFSNITTEKAKSVIPAYGQSTPESAYFQGGSGNTSTYGLAKLQNCESTGPTGTPIQQQECEAVNFLAKNPNVRPQLSISKNDSMIQNTRDIQSGADDIFGSIGQGSNTQCTTKTETIPAEYETNTCVNIGQVETQQCQMGRIVDIDADSNFQCRQTVNSYENVSCKRKLIAECTTQPGVCTAGGIVPGTTTVTNGSYQFAFDGTNLTLTNNITAKNSITQADFNFTISGKSRITEFAITAIHSDNWVGVRVNGHYIGTHSRYFRGFSQSSDRLEMTNPVWTTLPYGVYCYAGEYGGSYMCYQYNDYGMTQQWGPFANCYFSEWSPPQCSDVPPGMVKYSATGIGPPESGSDYYSSHNIDIRQYLIEGANTITMYVINGKGPGYGHIYLRAQQLCPPVCTVRWDDSACSTLQQRAK